MKEALTKINKNKLLIGCKISFTIIITYLYMSLLLMGNVTNLNAKKLLATVLVITSIGLIWIKNPLNEKWNKMAARFLFLISPVVSFALIEMFNSVLFYKMRELCIILNLFIYVILLMFFFVISNRTKVAALLLVWSTFLFGFVSYNISVFRGSSIVAFDFASASTAASVANEYHFALRQLDYCILFSAILFSVVLCKMRNYKSFGWKLRIANLGILAVMLGVFINIFYLTNQTVDWKLRISIWNPTKSYRKMGTALTVAISGKYLIIEEPEGYSIEKVEEIMQPFLEKAYANENETTKNQKDPNLIVIMNEAFSDLQTIGEFEVSEDYMPFFRSLDDNTIKGSAYVSVLGGNTANSEFEFLTGNTLAFFPRYAVPMQLYVKKNLPSINFILKSQGYSGISAMHPFKAEGWGRDKAYPLLGFDSFITQDEFEDPELVRKYISDQEDFNKVIQEYEEAKESSSDPFYMFNVTMQNHGGYDKNYDNLPRVIKVTDEELNDEKYQVNEAENYINLIKKTDEAFENLISYFEETNDPTIIVMFGDHQPSIPAFQKRLSERDGKSERLYDYQVPFIIWANYDIEEQELERTSLNYLSSYVSDVMGVQKTPYQEYLIELSKEIPVITVFGYYGTDGKFYKLDNMESPYYEKILEYQYLQYNGVFDSKNRIDDFFFIDKEY